MYLNLYRFKFYFVKTSIKGLRCQGFSNNIYTCQKSAQSLRKRKRRGGIVVEKDKRGLALSLIYMLFKSLNYIIVPVSFVPSQKYKV